MILLAGILRRVRALSDRSGVAAVEFAMLVPVLALVSILMLDFVYAFNAKLKLTNAVTAAAQYAFQNGRSLAASDVAAFNARVAGVVTSTAHLSIAPTVTVRFNGVADGSRADQYFCLSGSPPVWTSTAGLVASCGGNIQSGRFVTIEASASQATLFSSNPVLGNLLDFSDQAIVRVQ